MSVESEDRTSDRLLVQHEAIAAIPLISFVVVVLIGLGSLTFLASYWFKREGEQVELGRAAQATYPELERFRVAGLQQLNRYEMLENGTFRIPIEQAIMRIAEEFPDSIRISEEIQP